MRCDLHIHSIAAGMCTTPWLDRVSKESYNLPDEVYAHCKKLGMSIVTLTHHDLVDAAEKLRCHPDFLVSEEVTCQMPSGTEVHIGVYNIGERDHVEIQRRRKDFVSLLMYLTEQKLFFSVNHVFSGLTGRRDADDFHWFASYVPAFETRNGQMCSEANRQAAALARKLGKIAIGGSDSHTMRGVGRTYTEGEQARTVARQVWGFIERRDHRLMRRLNRWRAPRWIRIWMIAATRLGDGWLWYALAALLLVFGGPQRFAAVSAAASAALAGVAVFKILKSLSHRQRPCQLEPHCWSKVLPPDKFSFPSGHTMTAFSIALVVSYFYPALEGTLFFVAFSIAVSRIVLGMHFLSDVLAGIVLGIALGCAAITALASFGLA